MTILLSHVARLTVAGTLVLFALGCESRLDVDDNEKDALERLGQFVIEQGVISASVNADRLLLWEGGKLSDKTLNMPSPIYQNLQEADLNVRGVEADSTSIKFILGGAVDDQWGIMKQRKSSVNLDGLRSLQWVGGRWYVFRTL